MQMKNITFYLIIQNNESDALSILKIEIPYNTKCQCCAQWDIKTTSIGSIVMILNDY